MLRITMTYPPRNMEEWGSIASKFGKDLQADNIVEGPEFVRFDIEYSEALQNWIWSWVRVIGRDAPTGTLQIEKLPDAKPDNALDALIEEGPAEHERALGTTLDRRNPVRDVPATWFSYDNEGRRGGGSFFSV